LRVTGFDVKGLRFSVRESELTLGVGEEYGSGGGMTVHNRLLVGTIVGFENPHLIVFCDNGVMLGINLNRILRRDGARETETHQYHTTQL